MLPIELRCRIYDYIFGESAVHIIPRMHIEYKSKRIGYYISRCTCEQQHTQLSPRVRNYEHETERERLCTDACQIRKTSRYQQTPALGRYSLRLLQVCRQVYHEAALKPFQQAVFTFDFSRLSIEGNDFALQAFMNALTSAQFKAITRLRFRSPGPNLLNSVKLARLESLRHVEIQLNFEFSDSDRGIQNLERFAGGSLMRSLVKFNLKSIRLDLGLDGPTLGDKEWAALQGRGPPKSPTTSDAELFEDTLKRTETELLCSEN